MPGQNQNDPASWVGVNRNAGGTPVPGSRPMPGLVEDEKKAPDIRQAFSYTEDFLKNRTRVTYTVDGQRKVSEGPDVTLYDEQAALGLMANLKAYQGAIDELKRDMWWAGFYGDKEPAVGGDIFTRDDLAALYMAMDTAELQGGMDVVDLVSSLAVSGRTRNAPLGATVDPEDDPAFAFRSFAEKNGITLSNDFITNRIAAIAAGDTSLQAELAMVQERFVKNAYPAFADQLAGGAASKAPTMEDIAAPYKSVMAQILELPEDSISLKDKTLRSAMQSKDKDGKPAYVPLWKFEQDLRKDKRWQYTDNAHQMIGSAVDGALAEMGF